MSSPVVWTSEANADLKEAFAWYEGKNPGFGLQFVSAVESAVAAIAEHPLHFQTVHNQMRRIGVRRFPYGIFFQVEPERIVVFACMHGRRNPKRWKIRRTSY